MTDWTHFVTCKYEDEPIDAMVEVLVKHRASHGAIRGKTGNFRVAKNLTPECIAELQAAGVIVQENTKLHLT